MFIRLDRLLLLLAPVRLTSFAVRRACFAHTSYSQHTLTQESKIADSALCLTRGVAM